MLLGNGRRLIVIVVMLRLLLGYDEVVRGLITVGTRVRGTRSGSRMLWRTHLSLRRLVSTDLIVLTNR